MTTDWFKIRLKRLKARQSRQNQVYLAFSSQKQVRCAAGQSQGSWRVICTWFLNVPVFGIQVTKYTYFWQKPWFFLLFLAVKYVVAPSPTQYPTHTRKHFYNCTCTGTLPLHLHMSFLCGMYEHVIHTAVVLCSVQLLLYHAKINLTTGLFNMWYSYSHFVRTRTLTGGLTLSTTYRL